ncbi:hypothetical protein ACIPC1_21990 [Streptomyces sp. NPDC087263]|uniref:hypothetical protein n=1 Tax=Streptomyces sp. NPDC087263 TaxID=3365773 RepID=UPI0037F7511B
MTELECIVVLPRIGYPLEAEVSPYAQEVVERTFPGATNIACWANDSPSHPKESARSRIVQSRPVVLSARLHVGVQDALRLAADPHEGEATVRANAGPQLHRYLDDLRFRKRGNREWPLETPHDAMGEAS